MSARVDDPASMTRETGTRETATNDGAGNSMSLMIVRDVRLLLIAIWLGAAVFFSFVVAPTVFSVLPSRELAGAVVSRSLDILNIFGVVTGLVPLAGALPFKNTVGRGVFYLEIISLGLLGVSSFVGKWVIAAQMQSLRAAMGRPVDEVAQGDALRIAFNNLHGYSVAALSVAMIAGIVSLLLIARRAGR